MYRSGAAQLPVEATTLLDIGGRILYRNRVAPLPGRS